MEIVHKAALYAVMIFVTVGGAISLAGPQVASEFVENSETDSKATQEEVAAPSGNSELLATDERIPQLNAGT